MIFFLITSPIYLGLALWLLVNSLRTRAIRGAIADHDAYARDRVLVRRRPGFHEDHKEIAIQQRAQRELHGLPIRVTLEHVRRLTGRG